MDAVTNVCFNREERQTLERAVVWGGLAEDDRATVLKRLSQKDPTGMPHRALSLGWEVLREIIAKATQDQMTFTEAAKTAPEEAEGLIARPRQAMQMIVDSRGSAIRDCTAALELIEQALRMATEPIDERAGV